MTVRHLEALFAPGSVAVVGASNETRSVGQVVMRNLLRGGFDGPIMPVNPRYRSVAGVLAWPDVRELPVVPDLAVVCTPPDAIPDIVRALGERGTRAAVVLTAGLRDAGRDSPLAALRTATAKHGLRVLGPNCLGIAVPGIGLDATFAHASAAPGRVAFVSQSGALCTAVLDWAAVSGVGFSHFVSLGNGLDVDAGDVLDHLGGDPAARAILLYLESLDEARKFMSAARAAARNKPVIAVKAGRVEEGARAAFSHTGALAGMDAVYDAAFRRAGMLRVDEVGELFDAAETLARAKRPRGDRLVILGNGGGPGVMATDALVAGGGRLQELSPETLRRLGEVLPETWSGANPVDIVGDAPGERYRKALEALLPDPEIEAVLVVHSPTALASGEEAARAVVTALREAPRKVAVFTCFLGDRDAEPGRRILRDAGVPTFRTPKAATGAFLQLVRYRRSQEMLMETPPSLPAGPKPRADEVRRVVEAALREERETLSEVESKEVLEAYGVPVVATRRVADPAAAARAARELGLPVALKIVSPDLSHKSDVGGVALDLETPEAVEAAARAMHERLSELRPDARLEGFAVQQMARRAGAHELLVGATTDPVFGPVILFGQGGTATEVVADRALALPPLNAHLAAELVSRTRVAKLLAGVRGSPAADGGAILRTLQAVSQLLVDHPEIAELDVNPLLADADGVLALDARMRVAPAPSGGQRLAIRPYPAELEETLVLQDGRQVRVRPIRPEDEPAHRRFFERLSPEDVRFRFFGVVREMPHGQLARYTQIDYDREMAFVASDPDDPEPETLGVVRAVTDPDNVRAEFAIVVRSDQKGRGLGHALLEKMIRYCRTRGTQEMVGEILRDNRRMLELASSLGFERTRRYDDVVEVRLPLHPTRPSGREPRRSGGERRR